MARLWLNVGPTRKDIRACASSVAAELLMSAASARQAPD
jgi:hypothetical protein